MSNTKVRMMTGRTLLLIIIVSGLVGVGSGVAATYLAGERHPIVGPEAREFYLFTDAYKMQLLLNGNRGFGATK